MDLFSTDLNLTTRGVEKHVSYFSEQISGIIPLHLHPAEVCRLFSLHHVKRDQVFVLTASNWSPDPPLGLLPECVSQSEPSLVVIQIHSSLQRLQRQTALEVEMWLIGLTAESMKAT